VCKATPSAAHVALVQQSIVIGPHMTLYATALIDKFVGPELHAA
jgi:hypothetical protein